MISVIIPIYNIEKYIENCIKSVINQTYKNLQIVLVDDGSTDLSRKICDEYAKKDDRILVIHKKNGGLADARNAGKRIATGDYIGFIDGDDYIFPTFYEELYNMIKNNSASIAECDFLRIKEDDIDNAEKIIEEENKIRIIQEEKYDGKKAIELLYGTVLQPYVKKVVVWNKLYKREILENIEFPVGKLHEDEYTTYQILFKCEKMVSSNKVLHGYIQTNNSIMRREIKQKRIDDNLDAYIKCSTFFEDKNDLRLESICRRRYLENCIELSGKIIKSCNQEKEMQLKNIQKLFINNYNFYIDKIKSQALNQRENKIIEIIEEAYKSDCVGEYWDELEKFVNNIC